MRDQPHIDGTRPLGRVKRFIYPATSCLFALGLLFLAGCGGDDSSSSSSPSSSSTSSGASASSGGATEISFLTMQLRPTFDEYFHTLIAKFEADHPGVTVKWIDYPFQNYETKLMTSFMGGNPPDVINIASDTVRTWVDADRIMPLEDILPEGTLARFVPNIVEQGCTVRGNVYAMPWYLSSVVAMANRKIFEEAGLPLEAPPLYYDDLPELCKTIQDKTGKFAYFPLYTEAGSMKSYLMDAGLPLLSDDGKKAVFYTPRGVEIVKFWTDLYKNGLVPSEALTAMHRRPIELYKSGRLAVLHAGTEFLRQVESDAPDVYANTLIGPQMQWKGSEVHLLQFHTMAVARQTKNPKLAGELADFLTNGPNQLAFCKLTTIVPSVVEAAKDPYFTDPEDTKEGLARKIAAEQILKGTVIRFPKDQKKLVKAMDDIVENICLEKMTADEGVKKAEDTWNAILGGGKE